MPETDDTKKAAAEAYWQSLVRTPDPRSDQAPPAKDAVMSGNALADRGEDKSLLRRSISRRRRV
jgi:hypothetical protein